MLEIKGSPIPNPMAQFVKSENLKIMLKFTVHTKFQPLMIFTEYHLVHGRRAVAGVRPSVVLQCTTEPGCTTKRAI